MFWKVVATVAFGMGLDKGDVGAVSLMPILRMLEHNFNYSHLMYIHASKFSESALGNTLQRARQYGRIRSG